MKTIDTPLFVKTHDFIVWLFRHTMRFQKNLRHSLSLKLENCALDFEHALLKANAARDERRVAMLEEADGQLLFLRALLRLTLDFQLLAGNQAQFAAEKIDELGRLLGAWKKGVDRKLPARSV